VAGRASTTRSPGHSVSAASPRRELDHQAKRYLTAANVVAFFIFRGFAALQPRPTHVWLRSPSHSAPHDVLNTLKNREHFLILRLCPTASLFRAFAWIIDGTEQTFDQDVIARSQDSPSSSILGPWWRPMPRAGPVLERLSRQKAPVSSARQSRCRSATGMPAFGRAVDPHVFALRTGSSSISSRRISRKDPDRQWLAQFQPSPARAPRSEARKLEPRMLRPRKRNSREPSKLDPKARSDSQSPSSPHCLLKNSIAMPTAGNITKLEAATGFSSRNREHQSELDLAFGRRRSRSVGECRAALAANPDDPGQTQAAESARGGAAIPGSARMGLRSSSTTGDLRDEAARQWSTCFYFWARSRN